MADSPLSIIKSYLVSLGFSVDKNSYDNATKSIDQASQKLSEFAGNTVKQFSLAGAEVLGFYAMAAAGITKFLMGLGQAQLQYEMLARQLWTTEANAEALSTTLKAMGVSLQDLYLSPTLMKQFQELQKQAFQMMPPAQYQKEMSFVQSITFEFTRMKLEATYALQWIGYYLIKYLNGPLTTIHNALQNFNDMITKTMPGWTKVIAEVLSWVFELAGTIVQTFKYVWDGIKDFFSMIPNNIKEVGAAFLALGILIESGPIGIITGLLLLLNDFYTYLKGGKSQFAPLWEGITGFYDRLKKTGVIDTFKKDFKEAMNIISTAIKDAKKFISEFFNTIQSNGTVNEYIKSWSNIFGILSKVINDVIHYAKTLFETLSQNGIIQSLGSDVMDLIKSFYGLTESVTGFINKILGLKSTNSVFKFIGEVLTDTILASLEMIDMTIKEIVTGMNTLSDIFQGKWKDAWKNFKSMFNGNNLISQNKSYIYPGSSNQTNHNNNQKVSFTQTNNIYGSDPQSTAKAATSNLQDLIYRNVQGVIL